MDHLLKFTVHSMLNGIQHFQMPNAFDDVHIELHLNDWLGGAFSKPVLKVNGQPNFFPEGVLSERNFYMPARINPILDHQYGLYDVQGLLTGTSPVAAHLAYDSHVRLSAYAPFEEELRRGLLNNYITNAQYADLRWKMQVYTKRKLSIIGRNLSEFPPFGKPSAAQKATRDAIVNGEKQINRARLRHRPETDNLAKTLRGVGTGIVVISAAASVYRVIKANNKKNTAIEEAGGWAGGIAGAEAGMHVCAEAGGAIGLCFAGGGFAPGAAFGGFIGGIAGGIGGSIWGSKITRHLIEHHRNTPSFGGFKGGTTGGGGASDSW